MCVWILWMSLRMVRQWVASSSSFMDVSVAEASSSFCYTVSFERTRNVFYGE